MALMRWGFWGCLLPLLAAGVAAAAPAFDAERVDAIDVELAAAIEAGAMPGAVFLLERGEARVLRVAGHRALAPRAEPMREDTVFDAASLTKVMATTPAVLLLADRGLLDLDAPVRTYLADFDGRDAVTVRHLLTHTSGLPAGIPQRPPIRDHADALARACAASPRHHPGTRFTYSDVNFILLGEIVARVAGVPLDVFCERAIFRPLGMADTGFIPDAAMRPRIAPTTRTADGSHLRGIVHDPTARAMGGVAGHAGLFTSMPDVARYARMLLAGGRHGEEIRLFKAETVALMTRAATPDGFAVRRGLGWDIDSPFSRPRGTIFPVGSYGHTGFTGTSLWIDPHSGTFLALLTSRLHPDGRGDVRDLRPRIATLAAAAVADFDFSAVEGAPPALHVFDEPDAD